MAQSFYWGIFIILENVLVLFIRMYSEELGEKNIFIIYNVFFVLLADIVSGLLVPIYYISYLVEKNIKFFGPILSKIKFAQGHQKL